MAPPARSVQFLFDPGSVCEGPTGRNGRDFFFSQSGDKMPPPSNPSETEPAPEKSRRTRFSKRWVRTFRWSLTLLVLAGLAWAARNAIGQLLQNPPRWADVHWMQLAVAFCLMASSQILAGWFWQRILVHAGQGVDWISAQHAYFLSQFGKYVPGKALVIVIRSALIVPRGVRLPTAVASVFLETLMLVAVGAGAGLVSLAVAGFHHPWLEAAAVVMAAGIGLASTPPVFGWMERVVSVRLGGLGVPPALSFDWRIWLTGTVMLAVAWLLLGAGMRFVLNAIGPVPCPWNLLPLCVAAVCLATVIGFITMVPGGLGVRELVILPLLAGTFPPQQALAAAVFFRLGTICVEIAVSATLKGMEYSSGKIAGRQASSQETAG